MRVNTDEDDLIDQTNYFGDDASGLMPIISYTTQICNLLTIAGDIEIGKVLESPYAPKQRDIVLSGIVKDEMALDVELEFGLKMYASFVFSVVFAVLGIILVFYAFGVGALFKTNSRQVDPLGISLACVSFIPMSIWLYLRFCPTKTEYLRRRSIRLNRKLRKAVERKKAAIFYDEDDEMEASTKQIADLERQIKALEEKKELEKSTRSRSYSYSKTVPSPVESKIDSIIEKQSSSKELSRQTTSSKSLIPVETSSKGAKQLSPAASLEAAVRQLNSSKFRESSSRDQRRKSADIRVSFNLKPEVATIPQRPQSPIKSGRTKRRSSLS